MNSTAEQYDKWSLQLFNLLAEVEIAHGKNSVGTYPNPLEMLLWLTQREAIRLRGEAMQPGIPS